MKKGAFVRKVRGETRDRALGVKRELTRHWREGRSGAPAEIGRWLGLGMALGALIVGAAAALHARRRD